MQSDLSDSMNIIEELMQSDLPDSMNISLSPCIVSSTCCALSSTAIKPLTLENSPRGFSNDSVEEFVQPKKKRLSLGARQVYLITYSQADILKVQSRKQFAAFVCEEFKSEDQIVEHWVVSNGFHRQKGIHYHLAIKLKKQRRFNQRRQNLKKGYDIDLDFKQWYDNYYAGYTYVTKFDTHFVTSENHPVLNNAPSTSKATSSKRGLAFEETGTTNSVSAKRQKTYKSPSLKNENVGEIIRQNNIKTRKQLCSFAKKQAREGKTDLIAYLYKRPNAKQQTDLIDTVWAIENSEIEIKHCEKSRLEILREAKLKSCDTDAELGIQWNGSWLGRVLETLRHNNIDRKEFSNIVLHILEYSQGKGKNIMICGLTNCAKSFILLPLTKIYKCFMTPSQGIYNWVNAPDKEIIFLNDIRYEDEGEKKVMPSNVFLNLLEGIAVSISMPKNFYS